MHPPRIFGSVYLLSRFLKRLVWFLKFVILKFDLIPANEVVKKSRSESFGLRKSRSHYYKPFSAAVGAI